MLPGLVSAIAGLGGGRIQFVGGATAAKAGATSGTSTIALNSGLTGGIASAVQNGDLVIAAFATGTSNADRTLSITDGTTDYTLIGSELYSDGSTEDTSLRVAYKFVSGDTATTFGPTTDVDEAGAMAVYVFRNVNQSTPLDVTVTDATGTNTDANPPTITPVTPGAFIVCVGASGHGLGTTDFTDETGLTGVLLQASNDVFDVSLGIGHKNDWTSGAFDAGIFNGDSDVSGSWAAMSIALRPA